MGRDDEPILLVLTGDKLRHQYFAVRLLKEFPSARLVVEKHPESPWGAHLENPSPLAQKHFSDFAETEKRYFEETVEQNLNLLNRKTVLTLREGEINETEIIMRLKAMSPKALLTLSTSILKPNFIEAFPRQIVNYHAGLSPYYRGSGTNVFPFLNKELQYVGITLHYIDRGIDSGDIILHKQPVFETSDNTHTIGCKNLISGIDGLIEIGHLLLAGKKPKGHPQTLTKGRMYLKRDFTDTVIEGIQKNLRENLIEDYLRKPAARPAIVAKVECE